MSEELEGQPPANQSPTDQPPAVRASDRDREAALEVLGLAVSDGQLTLDEYSGRVDVVLAARTQAELVKITHDLQQVAGSQPIGVAAGSQAVGAQAVGAAGLEPAAAAQASLPAPQESITVILSSHKHRGPWQVPAQLDVKSVLGETELDFTQAALSSHHTVVNIRAVLTDLKMIVPEGIDVRLTGSAILSDRKNLVPHSPPPGAPILELRVRALLSDVKVLPPQPPGLGEQIRRAFLGA